MRSTLQKLLPSKGSKTQADFRRARLLAILSLILIPLSVINTGFTMVFATGELSLILSSFVFVLLVVSVYGFSRTQWWRWGAVIIIAVFILWPLSLFFTIEDQDLLALLWMVPGLILASLLFKFTYTIAVNAFAIASIILLAFLQPDLIELGVFRFMGVFLLIGSLLPIGTKIRDEDELTINEQNDELMKTNEDLESRVTARTAQLNRAKDLAEAANQAKSVFLANMSHELLTPLNAIIGYSEMIFEDAEEIDERPISADAQRIQTAGKHLLTLVSNVLHFSKMEAEHIEVELQEFDLHALVRDVALSIKPILEKNQNQLNWDQPRTEQYVTSDPTLIKQILIHLLNNAAQFTQNGQIWLTLNSSESYFEIEVEDNGIGIESHLLETVFLPFKQVDNSMSRQYDGSGLGLAITKRLCGVLGGEITVESQIDHGSTFRVALPMNVPAQLVPI